MDGTNLPEGDPLGDHNYVDSLQNPQSNICIKYSINFDIPPSSSGSQDNMFDDCDEAAIAVRNLLASMQPDVQMQQFTEIEQHETTAFVKQPDVQMQQFTEIEQHETTALVKQPDVQMQQFTEIEQHETTALVKQPDVQMQQFTEIEQHETTALVKQPDVQMQQFTEIEQHETTALVKQPDVQMQQFTEIEQHETTALVKQPDVQMQQFTEIEQHETTALVKPPATAQPKTSTQQSCLFLGTGSSYDLVLLDDPANGQTTSQSLVARIRFAAAIGLININDAYDFAQNIFEFDSKLWNVWDVDVFEHLSNEPIPGATVSQRQMYSIILTLMNRWHRSKMIEARKHGKLCECMAMEFVSCPYEIIPVEDLQMMPGTSNSNELEVGAKPEDGDPDDSDDLEEPDDNADPEDPDDPEDFENFDIEDLEDLDIEDLDIEDLEDLENEEISEDTDDREDEESSENTDGLKLKVQKEPESAQVQGNQEQTQNFYRCQHEMSMVVTEDESVWIDDPVEGKIHTSETVEFAWYLNQYGPFEFRDFEEEAQNPLSCIGLKRYYAIPSNTHKELFGFQRQSLGDFIETLKNNDIHQKDSDEEYEEEIVYRTSVKRTLVGAPKPMVMFSRKQRKQEVSEDESSSDCEDSDDEQEEDLNEEQEEDLNEEQEEDLHEEQEEDLNEEQEEDLNEEQEEDLHEEQEEDLHEEQEEDLNEEQEEDLHEEQEEDLNEEQEEDLNEEQEEDLNEEQEEDLNEEQEEDLNEEQEEDLNEEQEEDLNEEQEEDLNEEQEEDLNEEQEEDLHEEQEEDLNEKQEEDLNEEQEEDLHEEQEEDLNEEQEEDLNEEQEEDLHEEQEEDLNEEQEEDLNEEQEEDLHEEQEEDLHEEQEEDLNEKQEEGSHGDQKEGSHGDQKEGSHGDQKKDLNNDQNDDQKKCEITFRVQSGNQTKRLSEIHHLAYKSILEHVADSLGIADLMDVQKISEILHEDSDEEKNVYRTTVKRTFVGTPKPMAMFSRKQKKQKVSENKLSSDCVDSDDKQNENSHGDQEEDSHGDKKEGSHGDQEEGSHGDQKRSDKEKLGSSTDADSLGIVDLMDVQKISEILQEDSDEEKNVYRTTVKRTFVGTPKPMAMFSRKQKKQKVSENKLSSDCVDSDDKQNENSHGDKEEDSHGDQEEGSHGDQEEGSHGDQEEDLNADQEEGSHGDQEEGSHGDQEEGSHGDQKRSDKEKLGSSTDADSLGIVDLMDVQKISEILQEDSDEEKNVYRTTVKRTFVGTPKPMAMFSRKQKKQKVSENKLSSDCVDSDDKQNENSHGDKEEDSHGDQEEGSHGDQEEDLNADQEEGSHGDQEEGSHGDQEEGSHGDQKRSDKEKLGSSTDADSLGIVDLMDVQKISEILQEDSDEEKNVYRTTVKRTFVGTPKPMAMFSRKQKKQKVSEDELSSDCEDSNDDQKEDLNEEQEEDLNEEQEEDLNEEQEEGSHGDQEEDLNADQKRSDKEKLGSSTDAAGTNESDHLEKCATSQSDPIDMIEINKAGNSDGQQPDRFVGVYDKFDDSDNSGDELSIVKKFLEKKRKQKLRELEANSNTSVNTNAKDVNISSDAGNCGGSVENPESVENRDISSDSAKNPDEAQDQDNVQNQAKAQNPDNTRKVKGCNNFEFSTSSMTSFNKTKNSSVSIDVRNLDYDDKPKNRIKWPNEDTLLYCENWNKYLHNGELDEQNHEIWRIKSNDFLNPNFREFVLLMRPKLESLIIYLDNPITNSFMYNSNDDTNLVLLDFLDTILSKRNLSRLTIRIAEHIRDKTYFNQLVACINSIKKSTLKNLTLQVDDYELYTPYSNLRSHERHSLVNTPEQWFAHPIRPFLGNVLPNLEHFTYTGTITHFNRQELFAKLSSKLKRLDINCNAMDNEALKFALQNNGELGKNVKELRLAYVNMNQEFLNQLTKSFVTVECLQLRAALERNDMTIDEILYTLRLMTSITELRLFGYEMPCDKNSNNPLVRLPHIRKLTLGGDSFIYKFIASHCSEPFFNAERFFTILGQIYPGLEELTIFSRESVEEEWILQFTDCRRMQTIIRDNWITKREQWKMELEAIGYQFLSNLRTVHVDLMRPEFEEVTSRKLKLEFDGQIPDGCFWKLLRSWYKEPKPLIYM